MRTRTEMCAASFVLVLMYAASPGARQNERGQAIDTGSLSARGAVVATVSTTRGVWTGRMGGSSSRRLARGATVGASLASSPRRSASAGPDR